MTSRAEAREVLDVHAVEFSKTSAARDGTKKASNSHGRPWEEVILGRIRLRPKGSPLSRGLPVSVQPSKRPTNDSSQRPRGVKRRADERLSRPEAA